MWKKRISLWLMGLLLSVTALIGCSPEMEKLSGELVGEIVDGVIDGVLSELEFEETLTASDISWEEEIISSDGIIEEKQDNDSNLEETILGEIEEIEETIEEECIAVDGTYTSKEEVALYLYTYGELPSNYITKNQARKLGWDSNSGNLWDVAEGMSIGGDRFWNNEELLPTEDDKQYYECDIDYEGGYRNAKRIIYSSDGYIYYTEDHYKTFEQLYPES